MKNHRTNKPVRNFQKKKYYTNRNPQSNKERPKPLKKQVWSPYKSDPWLNGTFMIDPQTWEVKHIPAPYQKGQDFVPKK